MEPEYKLVKVEWIDAQIATDLIDIKDFKKTIPKICSSVGYLLYEDEERLFLGHFLFGNDKVKCCQFLPKGMVKSISELKLAKVNQKQTKGRERK